MNITHFGHDSYRDLTQLAYAIFGNDDGEIFSVLENNEITTKITYKDATFTDITQFTEKNDIKRSLYKCAFQIKNWDVPWGILTGINPSKLVTSDYTEKAFIERFFVTQQRAKFAKSVYDFTKSLQVDKTDISLYVHIPFCKSKCSYCSFVGNSIDTANKHIPTYLDCLFLELETVAEVIKNRRLRSIYIGGGTPTVLQHDFLSKLLQKIDELFDKTHLLEYTVEAGRVDTLTIDKLRLLKDFNVDRISINPQVFDDEILKKIGRNHTSADVIKIYEKSQDIGFKSINMDIIYGLGGDFNQTVNILKQLNPDNITLHTLAIKKGSKLDKSYQAELSNIDYFYETFEKTHKPYYMYRQQYLVKPYENIGFYRENPCLYNVYMMESLMDIISVGSGSTTKIGKHSIFNNKFPLDYINNIQKVLKTKENITFKE